MCILGLNCFNFMIWRIFFGEQIFKSATFGPVHNFKQASKHKRTAGYFQSVNFKQNKLAKNKV